MISISVFFSVAILSLVREGFSTLQGESLVDRINEIVNTELVSQRCVTALTVFLRRLSEGHGDVWAMKMLDASSKVPVGVISYDYGDVGHFRECIGIESKEDDIKGKYCIGNVVAVEQFHKKSKMQLLGSPSWSICLPDNCSDRDAKSLMTMLQLSGFGISTASCQTAEDVYPVWTRDALVGISILSILVFMIIISTMYDLYCRNDKKAHPALIAFSVYTNSKILFRIPQRSSNLSCLDGIRVLSMFWIIILHTYSVYTSGPVFSNKDINNFKNSLLSMMFINGDLACDAFLIVGGTLVTYVYLKKRYDQSMNLSHIIRHYSHRFIRLTPPLAGVVLVSATLLRYMGSGPKWPSIVNSFEGLCKKNWWSTLLYIQNEVNVNQMCVGHSWYLNVDMQLYVLSPLIFWMLTKHSKPGIAILLFGILSSITIAFLKAFEDELTGISSNIYSKTKDLYMNEYYLKTETRAAPWLIGTILGYILTKNSFTNVHLPKKILIPMWNICFSVILLCVFGGFSTLRGPDYHRLENAFYIALVRPSFSLAVAWIIWACATNHGGVINKILSARIFQFLNKFIYSMYLTHVTSLYMIVFSSEVPLFVSTFNLAYWFWGIFMFMFGISIIWVLVFEVPMIALEKIIFPPTVQNEGPPINSK